MDPIITARALIGGTDLEQDLGCHGEAVSDDWLFIRRFALPAVELQTAAAGEQTLAVHLRRRDARQLPGCSQHLHFASKTLD